MAMESCFFQYAIDPDNGEILMCLIRDISSKNTMVLIIFNCSNLFIYETNYLSEV